MKRFSERTITAISKVLSTLPLVWFVSGLAEMCFFSHIYLLMALIVTCITGIFAIVGYLFTILLANIIREYIDDWLNG